MSNPMRQIKFRAWIISQKHYLYFEDGEFLEFNGNRWRIVWEPDPSAGINGGFIPQEDFVLEQFTGLHDKNGKEIWEGDVVTHTSWVQNKANGSQQDNFSDITVIEGVPLHLNKNPYPIHIDFKDYPYREIKWIGDEQLYKCRAQFSVLSTYHPKELEVLGNIYENPKLLNV